MIKLTTLEWLATMYIYCFGSLNMLVTSAVTENKEKARCLECSVEFHGSHPCGNLYAAGEDLPSDCELEQRVRKSRGRKKQGKRDDEADWMDFEMNVKV
jgi:hypothetical protein